MEDSHFFSFKYEFNSGTGPVEAHRFLREFNMEIIADIDDMPNRSAGKVRFIIVYIDKAINEGYDLHEIFDSTEYTFRHGQDFFDFETGEVKEDIMEHFNYDLSASNICILENIEILPEFRGHKLAAKATKDIIFHFGAACSLFVIQPYPLQFEARIGEETDWQKSLNLNEFPTNKAEAFKQLTNYYKSFGFEKIKGYKDLLFYNPILSNKKMDAINLEE